MWYEKLLILFAGFGVIMFGVNAIVTRRARFSWRFPGTDHSSFDEGREVEGLPAILVGAATVGTGLVLIFRYVL